MGDPKKDFVYTIRTKKGKLISQEVVSFGSKNYPFPDDWKNQGMALMTLLEYKEAMINKYLDITYEEGSELTEDEY